MTRLDDLISGLKALGISVSTLRRIARLFGHDHKRSLALWQSGIHEARILASIVADPGRFKVSHARSQVRNFNSWDLCDRCCQNLFWRIDGALDLALGWTRSRHAFAKRAGHTILAVHAFKDRGLDDGQVAAFLPVIGAGADDYCNSVKKSVNWALRQIGKRNHALNRQAIEYVKRLIARDDRSAHWRRRRTPRVGRLRASRAPSQDPETRKRRKLLNRTLSSPISKET